MAFQRGHRWRRLGTAWVFAALVAAAFCSLVACAASDRQSAPKSQISQSARANEVLLVPLLQGGTAGWCLRDAVAPRSRCGIPDISHGAIFAEGCNARSATVVEVFALTPADTRAVSVAGGPDVQTRPESALASGLRSAWVELHYQRRPILKACPKVMPTGPTARTVEPQDEPLGILIHSTTQWRRTSLSGTVRLPRGACEIRPADVAGFHAQSGAVVKSLAPIRGLFGRALASCASGSYLSQVHTLLAVAVLTDAARPGSTPGPLPGMTAIAGRSGVFEADGPGAELVARRISGAWLVVQEGGSGLQEALTLLGHVQGAVTR
jgi:hypothetical protein